MKRFALALLALLPLSAFADIKTVTWKNAATNTDNSAIAATGPGSLVRTTVEYGTCNAGKTAMATKVGEISVAAPAQTLPLSLVVVQEYCLDAFHSNTFATTFVAGAAGNSARSVVAITTVPPPTPQPPTALAVIDPIAYEIRTSAGTLVAARIGRVELGTVCTPESQTVAGVKYNRVPMKDTDLVVWPSASPTTVKAWARCG